MNTNIALAPSPSPLALSSQKKWIGRIAAGLAVAFLAFDAIGKVLHVSQAVEASTQLGFSSAAVMPIGILEVILLALYLVPRTAVIGAVLWTAYLGGAIATHVRLESPLFSHILFPVYVAILLWLPLYLRDARVRALVAR